ncbi:MAG: NOP5/NOP56 family protein [Candidatus Diapherotrites archaeon]
MPSPYGVSNRKLHDLRQRLVKQVRFTISEKLSGDDAHVVRAVQSAKNMEALFNLLYEQTWEWYALHFPELKEVVRDPSNQLGMMTRIGLRENYSPSTLHTFFSDEDSISRVVRSAQNSAGGDISPSALKALQGVAQSALILREEQKKVQDFVSKQMMELAPNFAELATPMIAGQLMAKAGSLKKLAEMPSSTIQVLGSEEALRSHIRSKTKPPKHGYLFNHPFVKSLPKHARGKMARALSGKLAICIRVDVFGKERIVDKYKPALESLSRKLALSKPVFKSSGRK